MITREDLRELSRFRFNDNAPYAVSFYFQPGIPRNKAHSDQLVYAKDLVRDGMREVLSDGKNAYAQTDLERILTLADRLNSEAKRAKAIFACGKVNFWREFDLPSDLSKSHLFVGQRFHLKPLAALLGAQPKLGVVLVDRQRARLFELRLDELTEHNALFHHLPRRGRSDGYAGYDGGRAERQVADEALWHYKQIAGRLKEQAELGTWEQLIVGCHETNWPEFESHLPIYVKQRMLGRFHADVATAKNEEIRTHATRIFYDALDRRRHELVQEAVAEARGHGRGVTGLRRVLRSLELGEMQTLLMGESFRGHAVECSKCSHLDSHIVRYCSVCGSATRRMDDVSEGIIPLAIRRDVEILYVSDPELDNAGNIAGLLRFRSESARAARLPS